MSKGKVIINEKIEKAVVEDVVKNKMSVAEVAKKYDLSVYMVKKILNRLYGETATEKPASGRYPWNDTKETAKTADAIEGKEHIHTYKAGNTYKVDEATGQIYRLDVCTICGHIVKVPVNADIKTLDELSTKELNENQDDIRKELDNRRRAEDIKMWRMEIALDFRKGAIEYRSPMTIDTAIDEVDALSDRMVKYLHRLLDDNEFLKNKSNNLASDLDYANAMLRNCGAKNPRFVDEDGDEPDSYPSRRYLSGFAPYVK